MITFELLLKETVVEVIKENQDVLPSYYQSSFNEVIDEIIKRTLRKLEKQKWNYFQ